MKFLSPTGSVTNAYGVLTTPSHRHVPAGIKAGKPWAADNEIFTKPFRLRRYSDWLSTMEPYRERCLFVAVPDVVGNAIRTLARWTLYYDKFPGWPLAYVAQDGSEKLPIPTGCNTVFIGGSTEWKTSIEAVAVIRRAQEMGLRVHIGRVNWNRRYKLFRMLEGSDDFTCDGTRTRFDGKERTERAWSYYVAQPPLITI